MTININSKENPTTNTSTSTSIIIINIIKIILIYNSIVNGWSVKKLSNTQYELTKLVSTQESTNFNLIEFINNVIL